MKPTLRLFLAIALACTFLITSSRQADAQIGISKGQGDAIIVGLVAAGAVIGIAIYFIVRQPPSITGCAVTGPTGLTLQNEGDQQIFLLVGDSTAIKPGDRIRVKGKKKKVAGSSTRTFIVEKISKDFGPCKAAPPAP